MTKLSQFIKRRILSIGFVFLQVWWWIRRPHMHGVKVIIRHHENPEKVLCVRHSYGPSTWSFPGGRRSPGEKAANCARREMHEELDVEIENLMCIADHTSRVFYKYDHISLFVATTKEQPNVDGLELTAATFQTIDQLEASGPAALTRELIDIYKKS